MADRCSLCERRKLEREQFCSFHDRALRNLQQGYRVWNEAFGDIAKERYYSELEKHPETGHAVKEVIKYLRNRQISV
jgi:hypothetical protein